MTFRGVLLSLAACCAALFPVGVQAGPAAQNPPPVVNHLSQRLGPFGIPLPATRDPQAWQIWRRQIAAQLASRRSGRVHANAGSPAPSAGIIETLAGAVPFQKQVNALKTGFGQIEGIVEDGGGNLYVASCDLGVVLKIDPSSNTTVYAGKPLATGPAASAGDGGPATSARLPCPAGLALDGQGSLYISDTVAGTVRVVAAATGVIQTIAGTPGQRGNNTGDGGPATAATFEFPTGLALDGNGNLFVEDFQYVREVSLTTGLIKTIGGLGSAEGSCTLSATATCPATQVDFDAFETTIAVAQGHLYAALNRVYVPNPNLYPYNYLDGVIVSIDLSTGTMQLLAGGGPFAGTSSTYPAIGLQMDPQGLTSDAAGNLYIAGSSQPPASGTMPNHSPSVVLIEELLASDHTLHVIAGNGGPYGYSGDGGSATAAGLDGPGAICLSSNGSATFVDTFRIRSFSIGGNIATIAGNGSANYFGDIGPAPLAGLDQPSSVVADAQGNLYVADQQNLRIRRIDAVTGIITTVAGDGMLYGTLADGEPALQGAMLPTDLALDQSDHLYVRDLYGLRVVDLKAGTISTLLPNVVTSGGMVFDGDKTLYIASPHSASLGPSLTANDQVWAIDLTAGTPTVIAGNGMVSQQPTGDGGPATQASLEEVSGLALDGQGNLYLADSSFSDIRRINLATGTIQTIAAEHPVDEPIAIGYSGDGGPAVNATLSRPTGLVYDGAGHLVVLDSGNDVLRQIDLTSNIITTIAGDHTRGFGGDGSAPTSAMVYSPLAATYDPTGNLFIADSSNNRVRRVVLHPTKLTAALGFAGDPSIGGGTAFVATYSGLSFGIAPTGTVTFSTGGTSLGSSTLAAATDGSGNYVASFTATSLPANGATVTAQYSGDVHYAAVTTTAPFQPPTPSYTLSANPTSLTIKQGASGSIAFSVTPLNGFQQTVSFSCNNTTLPQGVTCSFTPASVTPNGSSAVTSTLTVQTTAATTTASNVPARSLFGWLPSGGSVLALLLFGIPGRRRKAWQSWIFAFLFVVYFAGTLGCGGSSSNGGGSKQNANATPVGAYSIQINASAGTGASAIAQPLTISITVTQ